MKEIERKFLVTAEKFVKNNSQTIMKQAYLSVDPERVVRVRVEGDEAWITIKGLLKGIVRPEFEYEIPVSDAEELLKLGLYAPIEKIRHRIIVEGTLWEVDEFLGENAGLLMAEVELENENQLFSKPEWLGLEVTHERRYYNSQLSQVPYNKWTK